MAPRLLPAALVALVAALPAAAQIAVTRADVLAQVTSTGTASQFDLGSDAGLPALQALADRSGGGQTWDLTGVAWQAGLVSTYGPAAGAVPGSDLPELADATHVGRIVEDGTEAFAFYRISDAGYDALGATAEEDGETVGALFLPSLRLHPLPLTASTAWTSEYELRLVPTIDGIETRSAETSAVEGWGTLVTPAGSAAVLKVRTLTVTTSSIEIPGQPPFESVDSLYTVAFVSGDGALASIDLDAEGLAQGASYTVFDRSGGGTGVDGGPGLEALAASLRSANPARRGAPLDVSVALPAPATVRGEVLDALGRVVASADAGARPAGTHRLAVPAAPLGAGVYAVRVEAGGRAAVLRVTVVE